MNRNNENPSFRPFFFARNASKGNRGKDEKGEENSSFWVKKACG
jgi:hypothetical protein